MVLMGTQETNIVEVRTQKTSLELPFTTTEKESEEVLVSRAQDVTADGLKDKGKLEDKVRRMKEEISLDMLGFKSKEVGQQQKWIKTQELAIEEASQGQTGPFSVEGLTCAKLMITASTKDPSLRSALSNLPSWLSTQQGSAMPTMDTVPLSTTKVSLLEEMPVVVREQPQLGAWAKGNTHPWAEVEEVPQDPKGPSKASPFPKRATSSPKMNAASLTPISALSEVGGRNGVSYLSDPCLKDGGQGLPTAQESISRAQEGAGPVPHGHSGVVFGDSLAHSLGN